MKKIYDYAVKGLYSIPADVAMQEHDRIESTYGKFTLELAVQESKDVNSPLHSVFNWDDPSAAHSWRIEQARKLFSSIRVTIIEEEIKGKVRCKIVESEPVRALVNVRNRKNSLRSFQRIEDAILNDYAYNDLLEQAEREMESFIQKYANISELENVRNEMNKVLNSSKTIVSHSSTI